MHKTLDDKHTPAQKAAVVRCHLREHVSIEELAQRTGVPRALIRQWVEHAMSNLHVVFAIRARRKKCATVVLDGEYLRDLAVQWSVPFVNPRLLVLNAIMSFVGSPNPELHNIQIGEITYVDWAPTEIDASRGDAFRLYWNEVNALPRLRVIACKPSEFQFPDRRMSLYPTPRDAVRTLLRWSKRLAGEPGHMLIVATADTQCRDRLTELRAAGLPVVAIGDKLAQDAIGSVDVFVPVAPGAVEGNGGCFPPMRRGGGPWDCHLHDDDI